MDAARETARAAARGEPAIPAGRRVAPDGARIEVAVSSDRVRATVRARVHPLGGRLPGFEVGATAVAALEPGITGEASKSTTASALLAEPAAAEPKGTGRHSPSAPSVRLAVGGAGSLPITGGTAMGNAR